MKVTKDKRVSYEIVRSSRATTDIVIERDGKVFVRAPHAVADDRIENIVESKRPWIFKTLENWRDLNATRVIREYRNGEGFLYLGRSYRLLLVSDQEEPLVLNRGRFCLRRDLVESGGITAAKTAFTNFYKDRANDRITERVSYFVPKVGVLPSGINIRDLGHRWASCSPRGNLDFHWKCIMAPQKVIDYIVVHELCHFHQFDHTETFWNEIDKVMPDYRERKEWLRVNGASLDI